MSEESECLVVPDGTRWIESREYYNKSGLRYLKLPSSLRKIGDEAFAGCTDLVVVEIDEGLEMIDQAAFAQCQKLERVKLPATIRQIASDAFSGCSALREIELPDGIFEIGYRAFLGCDGIKKVVFPKSLVKVGNNAFGDCAGLERVEIYSNVRSDVERGSCFFSTFRNYHGTEIFKNCKKIREVIVHEGVTELPFRMFMGCDRIDRIQLPSSIRTIKQKAFSSYSGKPILLPEGLLRVDEDAFGRENSRALAHTGCSIKGGIRYSSGSSKGIREFIEEGERRLSGGTVDVDGFYDWLIKGPGVSFSGSESDARMMLLEAMNGIPKFIGMYLRRGKAGDKSSGRQKCGLFARAMSALQKPRMRRLWQESEERGGLPPVFDVIADNDSQLRADLDAIHGLVRCKAKFPKGDLLDAAQGDRLGEFMMRLPLAGRKMDRHTVAKLFNLHAPKCIVGAYKSFPELARKLPIEKILLAVSQSWPLDKGADFIAEAEKSFPGVVRKACDSYGCNALWYCFYNRFSYIEVNDRCFWRGEHPMVTALMEAGCDPEVNTRFGISYEGVFTEMCVATVPKRTLTSSMLPPMPLPVMSGNSVVRKAPYVAQPIGSGTLRHGCPVGFVDASRYTDILGNIDAWSCANNSEIVNLWIPAEVKNIQNCAFRGCENLVSVEFENCGGGEPLTIGLMAFAACPKLQSVRLSQRLVHLGDAAFRDCCALDDISIPQVHGEIRVGGIHVFDNCPGKDEKFELLK